jgi:hypothetical protein
MTSDAHCLQIAAGSPKRPPGKVKATAATEKRANLALRPHCRRRPGQMLRTGMSCLSVPTIDILYPPVRAAAPRRCRTWW